MEVQQLFKSGKEKNVYSGLITLRKRFMSNEDSAALRTQCLHLVTDALQNSSSSRCQNVALSILGNFSTDKPARIQMLSLGTIGIISSLLKNKECEASVNNRACRIIGNLALNAATCSQIHEEDKLIETIVQLLATSSDEALQLTTLKTLKILGDTLDHKMAVVQAGVLAAVTKCLSLPSDDVVYSSLQVLQYYLQAEKDKTLEEDCAMRLGDCGTLAVVVSLTASSVTKTARFAASLLLKLAENSRYRLKFEHGGVIQYFAEQIVTGLQADDGCVDADKNKKCMLQYTNALCLCCLEAGGRAAIRTAGLLNMFLELLRNVKWRVIHERLISALACFVYCDLSMAILLKGNLISILLDFLEMAVGDIAVRKSTSSKEQNTSDNDKNSVDNIETHTMIEAENSKQDDVHKLDSTEARTYVEGNLAEVNVADLEGTPTNGEGVDSDDMKLGSKRPKYSIHSPSYQGTFDNHATESGEGPLNIFDAWNYQWMDGGTSSASSSPTRCYSPLRSDSPYLSPEQSPAHDSSALLSPPHITSFDRVSPPLSSASSLSPKAEAFEISYVSDDSSGGFDVPALTKGQYSPTSADETSMSSGFDERNFASNGLDSDETAVNNGHSSMCEEVVVNLTTSSEESISSSSSSGIDANKRVSSFNCSETTIQNILILISRSTYVDDRCQGLTNFRAFTCFIRLHNTHPRASRILLRIVRNTKCFENIVSSRIPQLFTFMEASSSKLSCSQMKELCCMDSIHSGSSIGAPVGNFLRDFGLQLLCDEVNYVDCVQHFLLSDLGKIIDSHGASYCSVVTRLLRSEASNSLRCTTAINILLLCRYLRKSTVRYLLFACGTLKHVLGLLKSSSVSLQQRFWLLISVCFLFRSNNIVCHWQLSASINCGQSSSYLAGAPLGISNVGNSREFVTFLLDGSCKVTMQRMQLVSRSPVFAAMLGGHYAEASQLEVPLPGISRGTFKRFTAYLANEDFLAGIQLDDYLELMSLADKYMVDDLKSALNAVCVDDYVSHDQLAFLLEYSALHGCDKLWTICVNFLLRVATIDSSWANTVEVILVSRFVDKLADTVYGSVHKHFDVC